MKKIILYKIFLLPVISISCGNHNNSERDHVALDSMRIQKVYKIDTLTLEAVIPKDAQSELCKNFMDIINKVYFYGQFDGKYSNPRMLLTACADSCYDGFVKDREDPNSGKEEGVLIERYIKKVYETDKVITFLFYHHSNTANGYYVDYTEYGVTFRKDNGRIIDIPSLLNEAFVGAEWQNYVKLQLKRYWEIPTGKEIQNLLEAMGRRVESISECDRFSNLMLNDHLRQGNDFIELDVNIQDIPMPKYGMYLTVGGLVFNYQNGELCHPIEGLPNVVMPYSVLEGFLNDRGKQLLLCK